MSDGQPDMLKFMLRGPDDRASLVQQTSTAALPTANPSGKLPSGRRREHPGWGRRGSAGSWSVRGYFVVVGGLDPGDGHARRVGRILQAIETGSANSLP
jgi:hypothetical protein